MTLKDKSTGDLKRAMQNSREKLWKEITNLRDDESAVAIKRASAAAKQAGEIRRKWESKILRDKYGPPNK